jgi:toxin ParE1/3/4
VGLKVRLDAQARDDLIGIWTYLSRHVGAATTERVHGHLRSRVETLARHPELGLRTSSPEIRILSPTRYPYRIYYTVTADAVIILHIRHTARRNLDPDLL